MIPEERLYSPYSSKTLPSRIDKQIAHLSNLWCGAFRKLIAVLRGAKEGSLIPSYYPETADKLVESPGIFILAVFFNLGLLAHNYRFFSISRFINLWDICKLENAESLEQNVFSAFSYFFVFMLCILNWLLN